MMMSPWTGLLLLTVFLTDSGISGFSTVPCLLLSSARAFRTTRYANVASSFLNKPEDEGRNNTASSSKAKLSRPERKALERTRKQRQNANQGKKNSLSQVNGAQQGSKKLSLHSKRISELNSGSTPDDVMTAIKRAQNLHDVHDLKVIGKFLLEEVDTSYGYGYRGSLLARFAVAALHVSNHELARLAIDERRVEYRPSMLPMESAAIIRGLLRVHNVTDALEILDDELSLPLQGTPLDDPANKDRIRHRALAMGSLASRHFFESEPSMAVLACHWLAELGPIVRQAGLTALDLNFPWARLVRGAAQCESGRRAGTVDDCQGVVEDIQCTVEALPCNLVYSVLNAMSKFPSDNNDRTYEALSNALVRRVLFVTGAVDMRGCPAADRGEAAFIGRSNVGKSSLVNMITNRKSLAYTSKRPGKTQQFNFFAVNDIPGREKEIRYGDKVDGEKDPDSFYIVDLPGFGFAKVPQQQRAKWAAFMEEYIRSRKTLRVLFHLVDARHGPIDEDARIMKLVGEFLPKSVAYVVVLTKADKNVKGASSKNSGKVPRSVVEKVRETMKGSKVGNAPLILTSAETKLGRDDIWRYMRLAAEM